MRIAARQITLFGVASDGHLGNQIAKHWGVIVWQVAGGGRL
jgi:hypothetical protein